MSRLSARFNKAFANGLDYTNGERATAVVSRIGYLPSGSLLLQITGSEQSLYHIKTRCVFSWWKNDTTSIKRRLFSLSSPFVAFCSNAPSSEGSPSRWQRPSQWRPAGRHRCPRCDTGTSSGYATPAAGVALHRVASQTPPRRQRCSAASPAGRGAALTDAECWTCS